MDRTNSWSSSILITDQPATAYATPVCFEESCIYVSSIPSLTSVRADWGDTYGNALLP
jgi:hypothetical protein